MTTVTAKRLERLKKRKAQIEAGIRDRGGNLIWHKHRVPCIRHLFRINQRMFVDGCYDCTTCVPNEENESCSMFQPVSNMSRG